MNDHAGDAGDGTGVTSVEQGNGRQSVARKTTRDIDANERMWEFFSRHRR